MEVNEITSFRDEQPLALIEAEQQLLGAILTNNGNGPKVADVLRAEHFFDPVHAEIYRVAQARIAKGHLASPVTMKEVLQHHDGLRELGGPGYLARLAGAAIADYAAPEYARLIIEQSLKRDVERLVTAAKEGLRRDGLTEVVLRLQHGLQALPEVNGDESTYSLLSAVTEAVRQANEAYQGRTTYLATGIPALDKIIRGLAPGDLMILGGATSMGKTATALEIATNVANAGKAVAFVSLEMSKEQLATRMISARSRVPYSALRDAHQMGEGDFRKFVEAAKDVSLGAMRIIPKHIRDIPAIHAACKRAGDEMGKPLSLIVVDYAQLLRGEGKTRYEQMTSVSIGLKTIAGMLGCPVIGLVQLSRDIGFRDDKRPQLSDIKETGQFENDADQVVFCHRESYWLQRQGPKANKDGKVTADAEADHAADMKRHQNRMELIVRKNRHGRLALAEVGFHDAVNRFWSLDQQEERFDE
jgi:replicative DNA helicase